MSNEEKGNPASAAQGSASVESEHGVSAEPEHHHTVEDEKKRKSTDTQGDQEMDWNDSDLEKSDDESPTARQRRHKKAKLAEWVLPIIEDLVKRKNKAVKAELHSENPNFTTIEEIFQNANQTIQQANEKHGVSPVNNILPVGKYRTEYEMWSALLKSQLARDNPRRAWEAYDGMHKVFHLFNREHGLPCDWNVPSKVAIKKCGERPATMKRPSKDDDTDSAASYSDDSESEESETENGDGIDALESRMRKEYATLLRGKVLYWWPHGTGTQILVRYGPKKKAVYRVRAGSSVPYDRTSIERVLDTTPGDDKVPGTRNGIPQKVYRYARNDVADIVGVGWKIAGDDEDGIDPLELIRPKQDYYPHTRVLVKWTSGNTSLERRHFIRRIANGNNFNGDRMIYLKAKELENAYWGYDDENKDLGSDDDDDLPNKAPRRPHAPRLNPSTKSRKRARSMESAGEESDAESDTSQSSIDQRQTRQRSKRLPSASRSKQSKKSDVEDTIRLLTKELDRLKVQQRHGHHDKKSSQHRHRRVYIE